MGAKLGGDGILEGESHSQQPTTRFVSLLLQVFLCFCFCADLMTAAKSSPP